MAKRIAYEFGEAGDLTTVPDISTGTELSLQQGWSSAYSLPKGTIGYRFVDRGQHNYLWNAITGNVKLWQENIYPDHFGDVDYPIGMITKYNGVNYIRVSGSGPVANPSTSGNYRVYANKAIDSDKLDGKDASEFLGVNDKAADSELLDGKDSSEFLGVNDKAADSNLLDGKDSTEFVQTGNVAQSILGVKTFNSSPVVPTPTTNNQAASKGYTDGQRSLAINGYQKLPGGLIIQWGTILSVPRDTPTQVNFPIQFDNSCFNVQSTINRAIPLPGSLTVYTGNLSSSGFLVTVDTQDTTADNHAVFWYAIGY